MKLGSILVGALCANYATAKKYYNQAIARDNSGVLGRHVRHVIEVPDDEEETEPIGWDEGGGLKGGHRRAEGEPPMSSFEEEDDRFQAETQFYKASSMDFIKKGIDPEEFEWVNPDEIAPGATTCGFLKPRLGSLDDVNYPRIRVYVCMRFADTQPAAKGNIFIHCGGPGTLSDCIEPWGLGSNLTFGNQNLNDYNILSIDQVN